MANKDGNASKWGRCHTRFRVSHPEFVQELLGYATIAITLVTYSHVLLGMADHAAAMEDALS